VEDDASPMKTLVGIRGVGAFGEIERPENERGRWARRDTGPFAANHKTLTAASLRRNVTDTHRYPLSDPRVSQSWFRRFRLGNETVTR
jgi:hypothetical protein